MTDSDKTIDIGGQEYRLSDLSTEVKELLLLHSQAQEMMIEARRKAAIHELAAVSLASLIKGRVDASANQPSAIPTDDSGR
jgi:hypothetical protein